ncbi:MAG: class A beta-lactamase-related serine hydrolase [Pedosphaera sp.]|nr:class A beta-lactamase-related serine hydrolase [Pedosphaera sp.]
MARQKVPGLAVAMIEKGRVVVARGYGLANVEHAVPVDSDTIFQSGSLGKQFTAALVMLLVEDGKIALSDPSSKHFPAASEAWRLITVRHLLTHTSGIPEYEDSKFNLQRNYTEEQLLRYAFGLKLEFAPGSRWNYSNPGYMLLGFLVQKASGATYGDLMRDRVFRPVGMKTARIISDSDIVPHRAAGYRLADGELKNQDWVSPILNTTADGCLYFSLNDLIAWDQAWRARSLLKPESWAKMLAPVTLNSGKTYPYGFGISVDNVAGQKVERHGGAWQGFKSYRARYLDDEFSILILANLAEGDPGRLSEGVAALVNSKTVPAHTPLANQEPLVTERLKRLLSEAAAGKLSPTELAYVRAGFFPDASDAYTKELPSLGTRQKFTFYERRELGDDTVYVCEVAFASKTLTVRLGITPDDKISVFRIAGKP